MATRGGKRPGAGKPKGYRHQSTLDKAAARELLRRRVTDALIPLVDAQIANALGIKYLVVRQKATGKFLRVAALQAEKLNPDAEIVEVWEKDPSVQAFADLLNRTLGKPVEQVEMQVSGQVSIIETRLHAARKRLAEHRAAE